jgi:hypothetical protein
METRTKEIAGIGQVAVDQSVSRLTSRRFWNIFMFSLGCKIIENSKEIQTVPPLNIHNLYLSLRIELSNISTPSFIDSP